MIGRTNLRDKFNLSVLFFSAFSSAIFGRKAWLKLGKRKPKTMSCETRNYELDLLTFNFRQANNTQKAFFSKYITPKSKGFSNIIRTFGNEY